MSTRCNLLNYAGKSTCFPDELPDGFSQVLKEEEEKLREKFDEALQEHKVELVEADDTSQKRTNASAADSTSVRSAIVVQRKLCFLNGSYFCRSRGIRGRIWKVGLWSTVRCRVMKRMGKLLVRGLLRLIQYETQQYMYMYPYLDICLHAICFGHRTTSTWSSALSWKTWKSRRQTLNNNETKTLRKLFHNRFEV